ncbi:MAG TPA: recombinase A [Kofleriaceae bacterium]|nr:recombinase A [Kofleriaceae bacterium]
MSDDLREFLANARGTAATAKVLSLDELRARRGGEPDVVTDPWTLGALRGRFVELSARGASATLTAAIGLVAEAQAESEPVAWIMSAAQGTFYPPDAADSGIDLAALVVVRVPDLATAPRAAERLLRSGAFGLVVMDFGGIANVEIPMAHQGRLVTLAQAHDAAVVCITEKADDTGSLGSLVSLRAEARRAGVLGARDFEVSVRVLKDKRRGPGWSRTIKARGPAGT